MGRWRLVMVAVMVMAGVVFGQGRSRVVVEAGEEAGGERISRHIYGHFAEHLGRCVYGGIWVGRDSEIPNVDGYRKDVMEALAELELPVLRWPGGCFADEYHWKEGIGPVEERPGMVNTHWGMVVEDNSFGTHEFMDYCERLGIEPYVSGNVGSGTPEEMQDWVEYMTYPSGSEMAELRRANGRSEPWELPFFGVGNENWGCGGNMTAEYYSDLYRRFQTYVRDYPGNDLDKIACGPGGDNYGWMETVMARAGRQMDAISLHWYVFAGPNWGDKGDAVEFTEEEWFNVLRMTWEVDGVIERCKAIMDEHDRRGRVWLAVDEWGTWWNPAPGREPGFLWQQNTLRDAVVAGVFLNIFNQHCDRVKMANIAQTVNVLQAMLLTEGEKMVRTPTYWVFMMYKGHKDARLLETRVEGPEYRVGERSIPGVSVSASRDGEGVIHVSLVNLNPREAVELTVEIAGVAEALSVSGEVLTAERMNALNDFGAEELVRPVEFDGARVTGDGIVVRLPAKSVVVLAID